MLRRDPFANPETLIRRTYTFISNTIAKADAAGIPYVGVLQAFDGTGAGESFGIPTAGELQTMIGLWAGSHEVGSAYFAWDWLAANWYLKQHPELETVIQNFYSATPPADPSGGLLSNGSFEGTTAGWATWNAALFLAGDGTVGAQAAKVALTSADRFSLVASPKPVRRRPQPTPPPAASEATAAAAPSASASANGTATA